MRKSGNKNPLPPRGLSDAARRLWRSILTEYDIPDAPRRSILEAGLRSFDRAEAARQILDREGAVVKDRWNQSKVHPASIIERDSRAAYLSALKQLAFDTGGEPSRGRGRPPGSIGGDY